MDKEAKSTEDKLRDDTTGAESQQAAREAAQTEDAPQTEEEAVEAKAESKSSKKAVENVEGAHIHEEK